MGAIGDIDAYQLPDARGWTALSYYLVGDDDEARQRRREEVLGTTIKDFNVFGEALAAAMATPTVCALGGNGVAKAAEEHGWTKRTLL